MNSEQFKTKPHNKCDDDFDDDVFNIILNKDHKYRQKKELKKYYLMKTKLSPQDDLIEIALHAIMI